MALRAFQATGMLENVVAQVNTIWTDCSVQADNQLLYLVLCLATQATLVTPFYGLCHGLLLIIVPPSRQLYLRFHNSVLLAQT